MAYKARKRKVKKNVPEGVAHIKSTFNNTMVTITDLEGKPGFGITSEQINNWDAAEPNDENTVLTTTEFIYKEADGETPEEKVTIQSLIAKVKDLEAEILILKSKHPEETTP